MVMEIFSAANLGERVQVFPVGPSRTKQSFREESEITNILARYVKTGIVDHLSQFGGDYGFASSIVFHEAMNVVTKADQMFEALPAATRRRFNGDPADFLEFVQNPENAEEMIKLGLRERKGPISAVEAPGAPVVESAPEAPEVPPEAVVEPGSGSDTVVT